MAASIDERRVGGEVKTERVIFYKQDHRGDPKNLGGGRVALGVHGCKPMLRAGLKVADLARGDSLVIAIGGKTAKDGLRGRLTWGGVPIERRQDAVVVCQGFYFGEDGPLEWRDEFPLVAEYVEGVGRGHRSHSIPANVKAQFIALFEWAMRLKPSGGKAASMTRATGCCPTPKSRCASRGGPR